MAWRTPARSSSAAWRARTSRRSGIPTESEYVRHYCQRTGRAGIDPRDWEFYVAFSMFRLAAILQGIAKRALDGTCSECRCGAKPAPRTRDRRRGAGDTSIDWAAT